MRNLREAPAKQCAITAEREKAALANMGLANEIASIGQPIYGGNSVAALTPSQLAAMQSNDQAASAFGMNSAVNWGKNGQAPKGMSQQAMMQALTGMPAPTTDANGISGYSFKPGYDAAMAQMPDAQRRAIESFMMNPQTGQAPTNSAVPRPQNDYTGKQVRPAQTQQAPAPRSRSASALLARARSKNSWDQWSGGR